MDKFESDEVVDDLIELIRGLLNDYAATVYSEDTLTRLLVLGAFQVKNDALGFDTDFAIDIANQTITPDPMTDTAFANFTILKAACIVERGEAAKAVKQGIAVRDGSSSIDLRRVAIGRIQLLGQNWCKVYDEAKLQYQVDRASLAGQLIVGPVSAYHDRTPA